MCVIKQLVKGCKQTLVLKLKETQPDAAFPGDGRKKSDCLLLCNRVHKNGYQKNCDRVWIGYFWLRIWTGGRLVSMVIKLFP
jgi:hypothetical protein